jgi:excisionase family DNA binding protein
MMNIMQTLAEINTNLKRQSLIAKTILNHAEASEYTGISSSTLYKLTSARSIPHYKPSGKLNYYKKEELDQWLLSNRQDAVNEISIDVRYKLEKGGNRG